MVCKRARVDIDLDVSFMCTRISYSTDEDWEKLRRVLRYLQGTIDLTRIIEANGPDVLQTWLDVSSATHHDTRGYTDGVLSMGQGIIHGKSSKQKIKKLY